MLRRSVGRTLSVAVLSLLTLLLASHGLFASPPGGPPGGGGGKTGTIVGEVVGASGPVAGATVMLFDGVAIDQVAETFSDANGNFQFKKVRTGTYTVTAISFNPPCSGSTTVSVAPKKIVAVVVACQ
ncbi:MAG: carboxypeptidase-like regulatory domain-containing protein [Planctomycetota bacterium]|jgi:hypothetical protein